MARWRLLARGVLRLLTVAAATGPSAALAHRSARPTRLAAVAASPAYVRLRSAPSPSRRAFTLAAEATGLLSVAAVVTRPRGRRALTCGFVRSTCVWQSGSSSGRSQRRITRLSCEGATCGRGDSNSHPVKPGLGPQPSASANSATSAWPRPAPARAGCAEGEIRTPTSVMLTAF